jgi:carbon monoxide dehydrogenase subunit G
VRSFTVSEFIKRPIQEVWDLVSDPVRALEWVSAAVERELAMPEAAPEKGTVSRHVDKFLGRRVNSTWEIVQYEPPLSLKARTIAAPVSMEYEYKLDEQEAGTSVELTIAAEPGLGGLFGKLADALVVQMARRSIQSDLTNLKELCEARS